MSTSTQTFESLFCAEPGAAPHTFDTLSEPYEFKTFTVQRKDTFVNTEGIRGTRSRHSSKRRKTQYTVGGGIGWEPSPLDLVKWLERILGTAPSGNVFALADTLPSFGLLHNNGVTRHEYTDCMVGKATFSASPGGLLALALEIAGKTEAINSVTYPTLALGVAAADAPFVFADLATGSGVTLVAAVRDCLSVEIVIDNMLDVRFSNSLTATSIKPKDRAITVKTTHPYTSSETALYNQAVAGAAGSILFTNAAMSLLFDFANLGSPSITPAVNGKGELVLELEMVAEMTSTTRELICTLDSVA